MSIANELDTLSNNISNAYVSIANQGGTIPQNKNTEYLPIAIDSIPTGGILLPKVKFVPDTEINVRVSYFYDPVNTDATCTVVTQETLFNLIKRRPIGLNIGSDYSITCSNYGGGLWIDFTQRDQMMGGNEFRLYSGLASNFTQMTGLSVSGINEQSTPCELSLAVTTSSDYVGDLEEKTYTGIDANNNILLSTGNLLLPSQVREIELGGYYSNYLNLAQGINLQNAKKIKFISNVILYVCYGTYPFLTRLENLEEIDVGNYSFISTNTQNVGLSNSTISSQGWFLSSASSTAGTNGITIKGAKASEFMATLPNGSTQYYKRNFILGNS